MTRKYRLPAILLTAFFCCLCSQPAAAQQGASGLVTQWQSQVMIDSVRDKVGEIHLHVHDDRAESYYETSYPGFRQTTSFDDLNPRGIPFRDVDPDNPGAGALAWAEATKEILEAEGKTNVAVKLYTVPRTTLYALTGGGGIHAINGETGQTRWTTRIGSPGEPTVGIASNNTRIIAVRGSRVYCLNALTGDEIWSRYSQYAPGGGVSMSDHYAYVTSVNGRLQMFPLNENGLPEAFFASSGPATFDPEVTANTVSWATERGYFTVARSNVVSLRYRLETTDEFQSAGTAVGDKLVVNSTNGKVFALVEERGSMAWEFAIGERLDKKPIAIGRDAVMIITGSSQLVALDANRGGILAGWPDRVADINDFVGASQNILYFTNSNGQLVGLNRASGAIVSNISLGTSGIIPIPNSVTDRLYVTTAGGQVRCLREIANVNPVVRGDDFVVGNAAADAEMKKPKQDDETPASPFESGDDPKDAEPEMKSDDPFAEGGDPDDPFSDPGGDDNSSDDKGSGDDPFGDG